MKQFRRILALVLVLVMFLGDLGIDNFMALSAYADEDIVTAESAASDAADTQPDAPAEENAADESAEAQALSAETQSAAETKEPAAETATPAESPAAETATPAQTAASVRTIEEIELDKELKLSLQGILPEGISIGFDKSEYELKKAEERTLLYNLALNVTDADGAAFTGEGNYILTIKGERIRSMIEDGSIESLHLIYDLRDHEAKQVEAKDDTVSFRLKKLELLVLYIQKDAAETEELPSAEAVPAAEEAAPAEEETDVAEETVLVAEEETSEDPVPAGSEDETGTGEEAPLAPTLDTTVSESLTAISPLGLDGASSQLASANGKNKTEDFFERRTGAYAEASFEGTYRSNKTAPSVSEASIENTELLTVLDAWSVSNLNNQTSMSVSVKLTTLPALDAGESMAFYSVKNGALERAEKENLSVGDELTLTLNWKSVTGVALVKLGATDEDGNPLKSYIPADALWSNGDIYLTGKMPKKAVVEAVPVSVELDGVQVLAAYDITIYANAQQQAKGHAWQPAGDKVQVHVIGGSYRDVAAVDIYHMADSTAEAELIATVSPDEDGNLCFEAESFSVYVIVDHEGGEVITPRVEFHFIDRLSDSDYRDGARSPFTASPYNFVNTAGSYQTTQILKNGESLEMITDPRNIVIDNGDGTTSEKFFYGWYVVSASADSSSLDAASGRYTGSITYSWPDSMKIGFDQALSITTTDSDGDGTVNVGDTLSWTLGEASGTGAIDSDGSVHVYLAPLFQDFYFINFRMGVKEDPAGLASNLLTRKLIVFGDQTSATVRIGNVECPSSDPQHQIFVGWETVTDSGSGLQRDQYYQTIDSDDNEINNPASGTGYYITVNKSGSDLTQMDLYPVFAEARWLYFKRGAVGNGSSYVGAAYRVTNDEGEGTCFDNAFFNGTDGNVSHLSSRPGYSLEGWYAFAATDNDGNITNLTTPADVEISYIDDAGQKQTVTVNTTAVKIVNVDNTGSTPVGSIVYSGAYNLTDAGESIKLFEVTDGKLYVYKALDDLTVYANWVKDDDTTIRVIIWKQKLTDDKNTVKTPVDLLNWLAEDSNRKAENYPYTIKDYDYEVFYTKSDASTSAKPDLTRFSGTYVDADGNTQSVNNVNLLNRSYTGFHYSCNDVDVIGNPKPNGTSVYNVYYDRDVHRLTFQVDDSQSGYNYTVTTSNTGTQYAFINGEFVQLTYTDGTWYAPQYGDVYTQNDTSGNYGLVDGRYVQLTPVYTNTTTYTADYRYTVTSNDNGTQYGIDSADNYVQLTRVTRLYTEFTGTPGNANYYGLYNNDFVRVYYNNGTWYRSYSNYYGYSNPYEGKIYTRGSNGSTYYYYNDEGRYTGTRYSRTNDGSTDVTNDASLNTTELYYVDSNGGKVSVSAHTTTAVVGYTYVDSNGVTQNYTGEHRYTKSYTQTGGTEEYTGTRYTRSGQTSSWYTVYIIEALYGQTISGYFPIPGYGNGERWTPQSNSQGWNQVMVIVDTMPNEDISFRLSDSNNTEKTMNYYVQALPGVTAEHTYNGVGYVLYNTVRAKYNFITSEDFLDLTGFRKNGSYPTINGNTYLTNYDNTINFYYLRETSDFTFDVNYPVDANLVYSNGKSTNITVDDIYYQEPLSGYGSTTSNGKTHWYYGVEDDSNTADNTLFGPDHYIFGGWYEDASCTVKFNFNSTMPLGNKIVYAKWTPETFWVKIDPNGGEINRVSRSGYTSYGAGFEALTSEYLAFTAYSGDSAINSTGQSTYIDADYGELITEYSIPRRFVAMSDAAAESYSGTVYYYLNYQLRPTDGAAGIYTHVRSAVYLTEEELAHYYEFYRAIVNYSLSLDPVANDGMTLLDFDTWKQIYVSKVKYRPLYSNEHWAFLGWYKVVDGVMDSMPYNFSDPVTESFTLKAMWRLDGGYTVHYIAEYTMEDGAVINGGMEKWTDPDTTSLAYSDGATTTIYKAPTELTRNGTLITDDTIIFKGFRLVYNEGTDSSPIYDAAEVDDEGNVTTYYYPGDVYTILAANADPDGRIYLQAVYQYKEDSDRRPEVTNLTIDANTGYVNTTDTSALPSWGYPGTQAINTEDHLDADGNPTQILFGDIQSSAAVHLYKYATEQTYDGVAGTNFFTHPDKYFLLGFDDAPTEGDYVASYPADSVIAVDRDDDRTIYAVWEPMVYVTFVNNTGVTANDVSFGLSSSMDALQVINVVDGMYVRKPLSDYGNISLADGESIRLAFPRGAEQTLTVSGTNTLGVGKVLIWNSSLDLVNGNTTTPYTTTGENAVNEYSHTVGGATHTHALASGEALNTRSFSFNETMIVNENALVVTFTSRNNDYALLLDDNYEGGGVQEFDYALAEIQPDSETGALKTKRLPDTSTRIGYSFIGWAYEKNATTPDFSASSPAENPWTITDLNKDDGFFSTGTVEIDDVITRTVYAVWEARTDAVYVYKEVPAPGNQSKLFTFTVAIAGTFKYGNNGSTTVPIDTSKTFSIKHGEYLRIVTSNNNTAVNSGSNLTAFLQAEVEVYSPVENDGVVTFVKDTGRSDTVRWQLTNVTGRNTNGFTNPRVTVTEQAVAYYDTTVTLSSEAQNNELWLGSYNTGNAYSMSELPKTASVNGVYWTNIANAGGTVIFTNQRQTYDVTVGKDLISNTGAAAVFSFTASYVDDETTVNLDDFTVTSGNTKLLEDIPAGVTLTITEATDANDNYDTKITVKDSADNETVHNNTKTTAITVDGDTTVTYENTLKSYPVTFRLVDQDGNTTINGMFSLASTTGSLGTDLYASATSTTPPAGVFYTSDEFWADTYTLTQTIVQTGYIGLTAPVTITVTGKDGVVSSNPDDVKVTMVTDGVPADGYVITVYNRATKKITVQKTLSDPLLTSTRSFGFSYSYTPRGETTPVTGSFTLAPVSNSATGASYVLTVPIYASVTITEQTTGTYASVAKTYDTTVAKDGAAPQDGTSCTIASVDDDALVSFTNTRKTVEVTVNKTVDGKGDTFSFTALLQNGSNAIASYPLYTDALNSANDIVTGSNGQATFTLSPAKNGTDTIVLTVPYGANLTLTEAEQENYKTTTQVGANAATEGLSTGKLTITEATAITFTNKELHVAPTGFHFDNTPFLLLFSIGVLLALQLFIKRRRGEPEARGISAATPGACEGSLTEGGG